MKSARQAIASSAPCPPSAVASPAPAVLCVDPRTLRIRHLTAAAREWLRPATGDPLGRLLTSLVTGTDEAQIATSLDRLASGKPRNVRLRLAPKHGANTPSPATLEYLEGADEPLLVIALTAASATPETTDLDKIPAVGDLIATLGHDFNNLFSVILGSLTLLQEEGPTVDDFEALIEEALAAGQEGCAIIEKLVAATGRQVLRPSRVDARQLATRLATLLRRTLPASIELRLRAESDLPALNVDAAQFERTLLQLLVNAREAMPDGGIISVTLAREFAADIPGREAESEHLRITVADSGHGISVQPVERAFLPFYSTRTPRRGRGFGLSIARAFVHRCNGAISLRSGAEGTTVLLRFPSAG